MKNNSNSALYQKFYQNLGRLFYAIAAADGTVRKEEVNYLVDIVQKEWMHEDASTDDYGADAALQIEIVFDWLDANKPEPQNAFQNFIDFHNEHRDLFTDHIKDRILNTSRNIAAAFRGKNKSELVMLAKLQSLLNK